MTPTKLNLGCGRMLIPGYVNIDSMALPGIDVVADLENVATTPLPFEDNSVDEFLMSHVIEHITNVLPLMQELYRIAKPGALCSILCPHGSSDDACEDPTHVRRMFPGSFGYFGQPYYWRADYGYRGDWRIKEMILVMDPGHLRGDLPPPTRAQYERNAVGEMRVTLEAVKPARAPERRLQERVDPIYIGD